MVARKQVLSFGRNAEGQCGVGWADGATSDRLSPTHVPMPRTPGGTEAEVAAGEGTERRTFFEWARNAAEDAVSAAATAGTSAAAASDQESLPPSKRLLECSELDANDFEDDFNPVVLVACGYQHSLVLTRAGECYTFGDSGDGRLGHGEGPGRVNEFLPRRVAMALLLATASGPSSASPPPPLAHPHVRLTALSAVAHASCGYFHTVVVTCGGAVLACGAGKGGRLGPGPRADVDACAWTLTEAALPQSPAFDDNGKDDKDGGYGGSSGGRGADDAKEAAVVLSRIPPSSHSSPSWPAHNGGDRPVGACAGDMHTLVVPEGGQVLACGYGGDSGRLGLGPVVGDAGTDGSHVAAAPSSFPYKSPSFSSSSSSSMVPMRGPAVTSQATDTTQSPSFAPVPGLRVR